LGEKKEKEEKGGSIAILRQLFLSATAAHERGEEVTVEGGRGNGREETPLFPTREKGGGKKGAGRRGGRGEEVVSSLRRQTVNQIVGGGAGKRGGKGGGKEIACLLPHVGREERRGKEKTAQEKEGGGGNGVTFLLLNNCAGKGKKDAQAARQPFLRLTRCVTRDRKRGGKGKKMMRKKGRGGTQGGRCYGQFFSKKNSSRNEVGGASREGGRASWICDTDLLLNTLFKVRNRETIG